MTTGTETSIYAGLDLHGDNVMCSLHDGSGRLVAKKRVETTLPAVVAVLEPFRDRLAGVGVESTYNWYWLVDGLRALNYPVTLANPAKMDQYGGIKVTNDESDAGWIAEMLRLGILPEVFIYPLKERPLRDLLRRRQLLCRQRTRLLLSLRSMVTRHTGTKVGSERLKRWTKQEVSAMFANEYDAATALALVDTIRFLSKQIGQLEKLALKGARPDECFRRVMTIPGIGTVLGLIIRLESGPLERFRDAGHYASYCRGVPSVRLSNESKKGANNRKNGNKHLAWAFIEASTLALRYCPEIKVWYDRKSARSMGVIAHKALACKLAKAAFYVMRDGAEFDVKKMVG